MTVQLPRLTIITLNCRGIRDDVRRRKLFYHLRTLQADIICLQETHCSAAAAAYWTSMWAGPAVWSKHVGVLLAPSHSLVSSSVRFQERLILAEVKVRGHTFTVANLYAPPRTQNGLPFFGRLSTIPLFLTLPAWPFGLVIGTVVRAPLTGNRLALSLITGSTWPLPW